MAEDWWSGRSTGEAGVAVVGGVGPWRLEWWVLAARVWMGADESIENLGERK